ncbi:MAG: Crp/Fnr family transcriptional regulator [Gemmatimonadetes bacterium]|nr:Crp/Fnr family transcriptional regulator [Gemmatimonadota bacterium]
MAAEIESILARLDFARLNDRAKAILVRHGALKRYRRRQTLWLKGGEPRGLYIIIDGEIRIVRGGERQHVVHMAGPGETVGEVPLFDGGTYPATAIAHTSTVCLFIDRDTIHVLLREDSGFAWELLARLSRRVRHLVDQLHRTTLWTVRSRLASHLLEHAARDARGRLRITLDSPQADLAEQLGTVREVLARELATLRRHGIVQNAGRRRLEVIDAESLELLAGGMDILTRRSQGRSH